MKNRRPCRSATAPHATDGRIHAHPGKPHRGRDRRILSLPGRALRLERDRQPPARPGSSVPVSRSVWPQIGDRRCGAKRRVARAW